MPRRMRRNSSESRGLVSSASTMSVMMKRRWFETVAWKKQASTTRRSVRERVAGRLDVAQHLALELADALGDGREEQVFLVPEVVVERALGDARLARDAVDRGALVAVAGEAVDRRRQHLLARRLGRGRLVARGAALLGSRHTDRSVQLLDPSCN